MNRGNLLKPNMDLKLTKIQKLREAEADGQPINHQVYFKLDT